MNIRKQTFGILTIIGILITFTSCAQENKTPSYTMVSTGQVETYNTGGIAIKNLGEDAILYGQDGDYLLGAPMTYHNNDNGTITDENTGLMWEEIPVPEGFTWDEAVKYCENLNLGGHDDWRMPNVKELFSISDFSSGWPYINTNYFKLSSENIDKSEQYWSSNKYVGQTMEGKDNSAFGVNHVTGHIKAYPARADMGARAGEREGNADGRRPGPPNREQNNTPNGDNKDNERPSGPPPQRAQNNTAAGNKDNHRPSGPPPPGGMGNFSPLQKHVRAVRGASYGQNKFIDNADGTITDEATGLMWSQDDSKKGLSWVDALVYANKSTLGGHSDWRLPNVKELQAIVDYNYAPGASDVTKDRAAIDPIFSCTPITNEANTSDYAYYWTGTSARFQRGKPFYYAWYVAFGRAVNKEGDDFHGAGAVRFDTKYEGGPASEGAERYYNYVRLVRTVTTK